MGELPGRLPRIALTLLDGLDSLFSLIWLLICVLVVVVLAYLFTRYVAGRSSPAFSPFGTVFFFLCQPC